MINECLQDSISNDTDTNGWRRRGAALTQHTNPQNPICILKDKGGRASSLESYDPITAKYSNLYCEELPSSNLVHFNLQSQVQRMKSRDLQKKGEYAEHELPRWEGGNLGLETREHVDVFCKEPWCGRGAV